MSGDFLEPGRDDEGAPPPPPPPPPPGALTPDEHVYQYGGAAPAPPAPTGVLTLARVTRIMLWIAGGLLALSALQDFSYASAVDELDAGTRSLADVEDIENRVNGLAGLFLLVLLTSGVLWLVWQSKIRQAAEALGAQGFRRRRGWAIGSWFVPFVNFVVPKRELDDLWRAGDPDAPRPFDITGAPVPGLLTVWWVAWLGGNLLSPRVFGQEDTLAQIAGNARRSAISEIVLAVAAVLAVQVVTRLTARYEERAHVLGIPLT